MVSNQQTRKVVQLLRTHGWQAIRTSGSHTVWRSQKGQQFTLPDGHRTISAGVYRKLLKAIEEER